MKIKKALSIFTERAYELSRLRRDFSDRMNKIYMIFIYPDYPVDPVKKMENPIL